MKKQALFFVLTITQLLFTQASAQNLQQYYGGSWNCNRITPDSADRSALYQACKKCEDRELEFFKDSPSSGHCVERGGKTEAPPSANSRQRERDIASPPNAPAALPSNSEKFRPEPGKRLIDEIRRMAADTPLEWESKSKLDEPDDRCPNWQFSFEDLPYLCICSYENIGNVNNTAAVDPDRVPSIPKEYWRTGKQLSYIQEGCDASFDAVSACGGARNTAKTRTEQIQIAAFNKRYKPMKYYQQGERWNCKTLRGGPFRDIRE